MRSEVSSLRVGVGMVKIDLVPFACIASFVRQCDCWGTLLGTPLNSQSDKIAAFDVSIHLNLGMNVSLLIVRHFLNM